MGVGLIMPNSQAAALMPLNGSNKIGFAASFLYFMEMQCAGAVGMIMANLQLPPQNLIIMFMCGSSLLMLTIFYYLIPHTSSEYR